jgi:hypothetical protein
MDHCRNALVTHGRYVYDPLTTQKHFNEWVREEKAEEPTMLRFCSFNHTVET